MQNGAIAELKKLTDIGVGPFVHPKKVAQLMGCSPPQIYKGIDAGVIPICRPFASGKPGERPTRYVDMLKWIQQVQEQHQH